MTRPAQVEDKGNPDLENGDGLNVTNRYVAVDRELIFLKGVIPAD